MQGVEAYNYHITLYGRPPPMGRELFREWVKIFKSLHHEEILLTIMEISQKKLGKALTKVHQK